LEQLRKSTATARIAIRFEPVGTSLAARIDSQVLGKYHQSFHFAVDSSGCNLFLHAETVGVLRSPEDVFQSGASSGPKTEYISVRSCLPSEVSLSK
jgi:hypothetical protein